MSNQIALSPEQFIFAQNQELKTTSLKVAEAFGKEHKNILRSVNKLAPDFSEFAERNFELCSKNNELQNGKPQPYYKMTKDGFMFLVMGFTGKKAGEIKIAYINAFNMMYEKLFIDKFITKPQQGELFTLVTNKSETSGKSRAYYWSRFQNHFKLNSYKNLPYQMFDEGMDYLKKLEGECEGGFMMLTPQELSGVIKENLPVPKPVEFGQRFIIRVCGDQTETTPVPEGAVVLTPQQIRDNLHEIIPGYHLIDKTLFLLFKSLEAQIMQRHA